MKKSILNIALLSMLFILGACSVDKGEGNGGNGGGDIVDPVDPSTPDGAARIATWVKTINDANLAHNYNNLDKFTLAADGSYIDSMLGKLTIHGFKSDTQVIYKYIMPLEETGAVTVDTYIGMVFENNSLKRGGIKVEYEFNGDENNLEDWNDFYAKQHAIDNIDWDKTYIEAKALATADQKKAFATALNTENLKAENAKDANDSEMLDFTVADDGTFIIKGTENENGNYVLKDTTYYMIFYTSPTEAEFTNSGQSYIDLETLAFVDSKFGVMQSSGPNNDILEMSEIIAVQDSSAESKTTWIKSVNEAPLKHWEIGNMGGGSLKDFTLDTTTGVFTRGSVPNLTTYTYLRAGSATTAVYTDNKTRATVSVTLVDGLFKVDSSIVATTESTPADITAYIRGVNFKGLVYGKNNGGTTTVIPFTFDNTGEFEDYTIIRVLADSTVLMLSGSQMSIYALVGDKFGKIDTYSDEISISSVMAVMPLDTVDASHQAAFKTAIVGSYEVYFNGTPYPFTIAADGSFTLNAVAYTLHDTRSATEGIFKTTDNKYIGISISGSSQLKLHAKLDSDSHDALEGATTLATVDWFDSKFNANKDRN